MPLITDYASLQTQIANTLNRSTLTNDIPNFIQQFEGEARDDERIRDLLQIDPFTVSADNVSLPSDFIGIESLTHVGPTHFGPVEIVEPDSLALLLRNYGDTQGPPEYAAQVAGRLRFAPSSFDASYDLRLTYWRTIRTLSATNPTNWLLTARPDIYLYGALVEAEPFLKNDERLTVWQTRLEQKIEKLAASIERSRFGGSLRRQYTPLGG